MSAAGVPEFNKQLNQTTEGVDGEEGLSACTVGFPDERASNELTGFGLASSPRPASSCYGVRDPGVKVVPQLSTVF